MRRILALIVAAALVAGISVVLVAQTRGQEWPRWRGPSFNGIATDPERRLSRPFQLRIRWKRPLGPGYSGVVVADGHAVTMFSDGASDVLVSLNAATGEEEWRRVIAPTFPGRDGSAGGPVSTPAIHQGTVFAIAPRGEVLAVRVADGRQLWKRHLVDDFGAAEPHWGFTTSPLVAGDVLVISAGGRAGAAIVGLNRDTGATKWTAGSDTVSYQSPILFDLAGEQRLLAAGDRFLYAIDPRNGRELWAYEHGGTGFYGRIINPVVTSGGVLMTCKPDESVLLRIDAGRPQPAWTTRELKLNYATPVVSGGLVFGYSGGFLSAVDASTGALKWRSRTPGDGFPIIVDDHLAVLTKNGQLTVSDADATGFQAKAAIDVFDRLVWTPPSFADGRFYARDSYDQVAAIDIVSADTAAGAEPSGPDKPAAAAPIATGMVPQSPFGQWVTRVERAPNGASMIEEFLGSQKSFPVIEDGRYAHIVYRGDGSRLLLQSDVLGTGVTRPLNRVGGSDLYYFSLELEPDARVSYQLVSATGETTVDPRNPAKATSQNFAGEVSLLIMPNAGRSLPKPAALAGRLVDLDFDSGTATAAHLRWGGKRQVRVYLPTGYDAGTKRYPAVYVLYGEEMLTGGHFAATLEQSTGSRMRPAILVFVPSTNAYEYARTFRDEHARMMGERLVPWIDRQFRTLNTAADRVLVGADEAGFAAVEIGLRYPAIFGNIVAQSLFPLSAGDAELLAAIDRAPKTPQRYYVDWGRYDPRRTTDRLDVPGFSARVRERLGARGFAVSGRGWNDGSTLPFWSARAASAVIDFLPAR